MKWCAVRSSFDGIRLDSQWLLFILSGYSPYSMTPEDTQSTEEALSGSNSLRSLEKRVCKQGDVWVIGVQRPNEFLTSIL